MYIQVVLNECAVSAVPSPEIQNIGIPGAEIGSAAELMSHSHTLFIAISNSYNYISTWSFFEIVMSLIIFT